jgi:Tol biopolymer transport system component
VSDIFEVRDRGDGLDQQDARNLTARPAIEQLADWSSSGRQLAIATNHYGQNRDLALIDATDRDRQRRLTSSFAFDLSPAFAPDGRTIAFYRRPFCGTCPADRGPADIFTIDTRSGRERHLTTAPTRDELHPDWAPDGRAIVYASGTPDAMELFAMTPDGERRRRLTNGPENAIQPAWGILPASPEAPPAASPDP